MSSGLARLAVALLLAVVASPLSAQDIRVRDLTIQESAVPVRLMGYGIVVGLDGTGDRTMNGRSSGHTVQSVANLLRRFEIEVPAEVLRTRNVAAVLVTAEISPYLRAGGRFEVHVSSVGDARSIRGGVLWMTPLVSEAGGEALATAQGPLLISDGGLARGGYVVETTARIPTGGIIEADMPRPSFAEASRLLLREPELGTALRIAEAVNAQLGDGTASVEDPGSVALTLPEDPNERVAALAQLSELRVQPVRATRLVIDSRDGTVVAGGDLSIGAAVVSHGAVTVAIGGPPSAAGPVAAPADPNLPFPPQTAGIPGDVRVPAGTSAQEIASALHAFQTPPAEIAAIFESLREVGALAAEVVIR